MRGSLHGLKIDHGKFTKALDTAAKRLTLEAARQFVRAMIRLVPVWTGMAMGSIKFARGTNGNLGRYLNVAIPISPKAYRKNKNPEIGGAMGRYNFTAQRHIYTFLFRSDVPHFFMNNFFERTDPGAKNQQIQAPWGALEAGQDAYRNHVRANIGKLPKVGKFIEKVVINLPE